MIKMKLLHLLEQGDLNGFNPWRLLKSIKAVPVFIKDMRSYSKMNQCPTFRVTGRDLWSMLHDRQVGAGTVGGHYFHQDLWAAKKILERRPPEYLDIGSRIDGFIAHLLVFMPVTIVGIRPIEGTVQTLKCIQDDATELTNQEDNSIVSLSSLHAAEHFGLGRYGDRVDPSACFSFMNALERILAPGGTLYFSVPIGRERLEFNVHRVFDVKTILKSVSRLNLVSFSFVGDDGRLHENVDPTETVKSDYACGLFEFSKPS